MAGLTVAPTPRATLDWATGVGFRAVQLNAAAPTVRPRELSASDRRDLAATLRRRELAISGVDLWIPGEHFRDPSAKDRAVSALTDAVGLAADLASVSDGPPTVSTVLPSPDDAEAMEVTEAVTEAASARGVRVADFAFPETAREDGGHGTIGVGVDPAAVLMGGGDPASSASSAGARLIAARLSDADGGGRCAPGAGRLDRTTYEVSLATAGFDGALVVDLRRVPDQARVAAVLAGS